MATEAVATEGKSEKFEFTGKRGPFLRLILINLLLTILTFGIYRFWAKTKVRKFIWSNIQFMDDPLEYTGKATELLLGFLIVLAILFPLGLVYSAIDHLVPPDNTAMRIALEVAYYLVLFALIQIGFYRAWRYRMSRTTWRGIRLGLDGSTWTFLKLSAGWTALTALTLGLAYPWMAIELWRYQITHTRIGETAVSFRGSGRDLILTWLSVLAPVLIILLSNALHFYLLLETVEVSPTQSAPNVNASPLAVFQIQAIPNWLVAVNLAALIVMVVAWFYYSVYVAQYQISSMYLDNASINSKLPIGRLFAYAALALVVLAIPIVFLGYALFTGQGAGFISLFLSTIPALIFVFLIAPIAWTLIFTFELIKQLFITATVTNPAVLEDVVQSAKASQKTGEGLADALDIGGL